MVYATKIKHRIDKQVPINSQYISSQVELVRDINLYGLQKKMCLPTMFLFFSELINKVRKRKFLPNMAFRPFQALNGVRVKLPLVKKIKRGV
jgi:hypothetical protein